MNGIMLQGMDGVPICMTSNAEVCMRMHDKKGEGGGGEGGRNGINKKMGQSPVEKFNRPQKKWDDYNFQGQLFNFLASGTDRWLKKCITFPYNQQYNCNNLI